MLSNRPCETVAQSIIILNTVITSYTHSRLLLVRIESIELVQSMAPRARTVLAKATRRQLRDLALLPGRPRFALILVLALALCLFLLSLLIPRATLFRTPVCGCPENSRQFELFLERAQTALVAKVTNDGGISPHAVLRGPLRLLDTEFTSHADSIAACGEVDVGDLVLVLAGNVAQSDDASPLLGGVHPTKSSTNHLEGCGATIIFPWRVWVNALPRIVREGAETEWWRANPNSPEVLWTDAVLSASAPNMSRPRSEWWLRDGISVVAACMDRESTLPTAAMSWFAAKLVDEVVLVDWGSSTPALDSLPKELRANKRLVHARVSLKRREWVLSRAYNLGIALASRRTILKVDCDTRLDPVFLEKHPLRKGIFYAGDWRVLSTPSKDEHLHVNGLLLANRDDVLAVGAYDERITTYGWDDSDIAKRMAGTLELLRFDYGYVSHIPHDSARRVALQGSRALLGADHPLAAAVEIQRNRLLLTRFNLPPWRPSSPRTSWNVQKSGVDVFGLGKASTGYAVQAGNEILGAAEMVSEADAEDVAKRAVRIVLQRFGVPGLSKSVSLKYFRSLADKAAWPERYAEVALALSGGCVTRTLSHVMMSRAEAMAPPTGVNGLVGWRLRQWWPYPSVECECAHYQIFESGEGEISSALETNDLRRVEFGKLIMRNGSDVKEAYSERVIKRNGTKILVGTMGCGVIQEAKEMMAIRKELRRLLPATGLIKEVEKSLKKATPSLLDSEPVRVAMRSETIGNDAGVRAMAARWDGNAPGAKWKLIERAMGILTVMRVEKRKDVAVAAIGARLEKRVEKLFGGCENGVVELMERVPELAVVAAALVSASKCVRIAVP